MRSFEITLCKVQTSTYTKKVTANTRSEAVEKAKAGDGKLEAEGPASLRLFDADKEISYPLVRYQQQEVTQKFEKIADELSQLILSCNDKAERHALEMKKKHALELVRLAKLSGRLVDAAHRVLNELQRSGFMGTENINPHGLQTLGGEFDRACTTQAIYNQLWRSLQNSQEDK